MRAAALIITILAAIFATSAQNYNRRVPRQPKRAAVEVAEQCDTVVPQADSIIVAGFEKPLRSLRESMFVTNATSRPVTSIALSIDYYDMSGRQLHKAEHIVAVDIPQGETRRIEVPSFDRSALFYYHLSPRPKRVQQATPFEASVKVMFVTHPTLIIKQQ